MSGDYPVLACSTCKGVWIHHPDNGDYRAQDSVACPHCGTERDPARVKELKRLPTREQAAEYRARFLAKRADEEDLYDRFTDDWGQYRDQLQEVNDRTPTIDDGPTDLRIASIGELLEAHHATDADRPTGVSTSLEDTFVGHRKRFETLAEYKTKESCREFEAQAEAVAGNVVSLEEQLEATFGTFDGQADRTLPDPEPSSIDLPPESQSPDQSITIQPTPPEQERLDTISVDVPPTVSDWLPDVLEGLLPTIVDAVEQLAGDETDPAALARELVNRYGVTGGRSGFASTVATYVCEYAGVDLEEHDVRPAVLEYHRELRSWAETVLTSIGTGTNPLELGHDDLEQTIVPILRTADVDGDLVCRLDSTAWLESTHAETRRKTLTALTQLATAVDVTVVTSPRVAHTLESRHPEFVDRVTEIAMPGRQPDETDPAANATDPVAVNYDLETMDKRAGKLSILKHLERNPEATVKDLANDDEIALSYGSLRPYVIALDEDHGFVAVDDRGTENTLSLTERGEIAVGQITDDGRVVHPSQSTVFAEFDGSHDRPGTDESAAVTETPSQSASTVYGAGHGSGVEDGAVGPERALAGTGDPAEAGYVQWLPKVAGSSWPLHARVAAADARDGVNLNDYPVERWEDGRVTYVSCMEDRLVVSTQYGGTIPTLVRLGNALLDDRLWNTILTPSTLGDELEGCFPGVDSDEVHDYLVRAAQVGWLSEDEHEYDRFRDRFNAVRSVLLKKLGELHDLEGDERVELIRDAHGLLMSATALYDAVGIDISIELRVPDPNDLDEPEFCRFISEIVTRQASYGSHSLFRNFWEPDSQKRKMAKEREIDLTDPTAHLRASFVLSGPGITRLEEQLRGATAARDGHRLDNRSDYDPVELSVPVTDVSKYTGMRHAVETVLSKKRSCPARDADAMRRTVRLFQAYTGSPYDVVDALTSLARSNRPGDVTVADVEYALSTLPADRLLPDMRARTPAKILHALLEDDGPLGRSELLEAVGCSGTTYDKHVERLAAFEILHRVDGRKWSVAIAPWYVPETDAENPAFQQHTVSVGSSTVDSVVYDALEELGFNLGDPELIEAFQQPLNRTKLMLAVDPWIDDWIDVLTPLLKPQPEAAERFSADVVTIGERPDQTTLDESTQMALAD